MAQFRVVQVPNVRAFVEQAAEHGYDDSSMNFVLGPLADSFIEYQVKDRKLTDDSRKVFAAYRGDELVFAISKVTGDWSWCVGVPRRVQLSKDELSDVLSQLAPHVASILEPSAMNQLHGDKELVSAFIDAWASVMAPRGIKVTGLPPFFAANCAYATLATLPATQPATLSPDLHLMPATEADTDALARLLSEFSTVWSHPITVEAARPRMVSHVACGEAWVCRAPDGEAIAFCVLGRSTPRTIAIKNLYVTPSYRRRGIASGLVTAMLRYFLGLPDHGVEGPPVPAKGVKKEVSLNTGDDYVEKMYENCGFLFGDKKDPETGRKVWFAPCYSARPEDGVEFM